MAWAGSSRRSNTVREVSKTSILNFLGAFAEPHNYCDNSLQKHLYKFLEYLTRELKSLMQISMDRPTGVVDSKIFRSPQTVRMHLD